MHKTFEIDPDNGKSAGLISSFKAFFLESPLSYQSLDADGRYLDINPAWEKTFGYTREEILGRKFSDFMTEESAETVVERFPVLKEMGEVRDAVFQLIHKNGHRVHVTLHGRANYDEAGDFLSTNCILIDVSDKIRLQEERMRIEQLASIGELAANVAHEINNPISGVINYSQILLNQKDLTDSQRDILIRIQKEGVRVADIVHNLLNYSRDSKGERNFHDLKKLVSDSLVLLKSKIRQVGVQVDFEWPDVLPLVSCNEQKIGQVVINIVRNACQALTANEKNGRRIVIKAEVAQNETRGNVQLIIANNGPNIPTEVLGKIFEPFFTTKPAGVGTGLGLSISATIMKEHGGELVVRSEPGEMTEMILGFPIETIRNQG